MLELAFLYQKPTSWDRMEVLLCNLTGGARHANADPGTLAVSKVSKVPTDPIRHAGVEDDGLRG